MERCEWERKSWQRIFDRILFPWWNYDMYLNQMWRLSGFCMLNAPITNILSVALPSILIRWNRICGNYENKFLDNFSGHELNTIFNVHIVYVIYTAPDICLLKISKCYKKKWSRKKNNLKFNTCNECIWFYLMLVPKCHWQRWKNAYIKINFRKI